MTKPQQEKIKEMILLQGNGVSMNAIMDEIEKTCNPKVKIWSEVHRAWWRPQHCGYTDHVDLAGEYTLQEATEICNNANKQKKYEHYPNEEMVPPNETIMPIWE